MLQFESMHAKWNIGNAEDTLKNIDLRLGRGDLMAVIGPVGAGKVSNTSQQKRSIFFCKLVNNFKQFRFQSSLLQAVLGELATTAGHLQVAGKVSYACQEPWLFAASIRQNITFGSDFNRARYDKVVRACALLTDFAQFPFGDLTLVGERGSSLSGGQRARVNLAR